MVAAEVEEDKNGGEEHVENTVVFFSEHAAYAVLDEKSVKSVGVVGRREVDVETVCEKSLLNGGEDGAGVLEDGKADRKKRNFKNGRSRWW